MKWIGHHIVDLIARFRSEVYLEKLSDPATDTDKFLVADGTGKVGYRTGAQVLTDIGGTPLTTEEVQDVVGAMIDGNSETNISVTYDDTGGKINFVAVNTTYQEVTSSAQGLMSTAHHDKLDGIEDNATADQTQADINGLAITTVGTIGTGVWQGTTIKTAYIGDDQVTEDKLADTLLAEIDANTAKTSNVVGNLTVTAAGTKLQLNTSNGTNISIPAATNTSWGSMSDDLVIALEANSAKATNATHTGDVTGSGALTIADDAVTYAKMQNLGTADRVLGSTSTGVIGETQIRTNMIADDNVTEDKISNTLLAEIDANTAKDTNVVQTTITGNAGTATLAADATTLATPRAINGVDFDGSAAITVTAAGSTLSDTVTVAKGGTGQTSLAANTVLTGNGTSGIVAESNLTYDGTNLTATSGGTSAPDVIIESTSNHSTGGNLIFRKLRADDTPADGDLVGSIIFQGEDDANNAQTYGSIVGVSQETGSGTEGGKIAINVASHDGETNTGLFIVDGSAEDEVDVTIGNGAGSVTTIAGSLNIDGSNANLNLNNGSDLILEADNAGGGLASSIQYNSSTGNKIMLGATSDVVVLCNRTLNGTVEIRANAAAGSGGEVTVATFEDDKVTISQDLDVAGTIRSGITYIKILPSDFIADDGGRPLAIDDTGSDRWLESHGTYPMFASVEIPAGFKATHVDVYGDGTSAVTVYEADINARTVTSKGTGNIGTQINITDVTSDATNYLLIAMLQASGEQVNGGKVTIAKV